jgi:hypothetical protein
MKTAATIQKRVEKGVQKKKFMATWLLRRVRRLKLCNND